jgi:transcriptional regulator PpsR
VTNAPIGAPIGAPEGAPKGLATSSSARTPDLGALADLAPQLAQTFASIASDIALVIDDGGIIRSVATGSDPLAGPTSDWIGRAWAETVTGDTRTKVELLLSEAQSSGVTRRREVNHPMHGGHELPVAYAAVRLGRHGPVLAVGRDLRAVSAIQQRFIDAQQAMERDYWNQRQTEARYRLLFQVATDAVLVVDAESLTILDANRAALALFGEPGAVLTGQPAVAGILPEARPAVDALLVSARTRGRPGEIRTRGLHHRSGRPQLLDVSATPLRSGDTMLLLMRARAVEADADSTHQRLADFVERTPDAVVITDSGGHVLMANPSFQALRRAVTGPRSDAPATGRPLTELLDDARLSLPGILAEARRLGITEQCRVGLGGPGGAGFEVEVSAALLTDGDQECVGLTLRRIDPRLADLPAAVGELAAAIDRLAGQVGLLTLPELLQESTELAERHLLESVLARCQGDRLQAAQLLGIGMDNLWLRLRHHGLDRAGPDSGRASPLLN